MQDEALYAEALRGALSRRVSDDAAHDAAAEAVMQRAASPYAFGAAVGGRLEGRAQRAHRRERQLSTDPADPRDPMRSAESLDVLLALVGRTRLGRAERAAIADRLDGRPITDASKTAYRRAIRKLRAAADRREQIGQRRENLELEAEARTGHALREGSSAAYWRAWRALGAILEQETGLGLACARRIGALRMLVDGEPGTGQ